MAVSSSSSASMDEEAVRAVLQSPRSQSFKGQRVRAAGTRQQTEQPADEETGGGVGAYSSMKELLQALAVEGGDGDLPTFVVD